jgi:hypothetical protein
MNLSELDVERRLTVSMHAFVAGVPDTPPLAWGTLRMADRVQHRHLVRTMGAAASIVIIAIASLFWTTPSAGARFYGHAALTTGSQVYESSAYLHRFVICAHAPVQVRDL